MKTVKVKYNVSETLEDIDKLNFLDKENIKKFSAVYKNREVPCGNHWILSFPKAQKTYK